MTNHIHHDAIIAWAKGAEIEACNAGSTNWYRCDTPMWWTDVQYRVKPKTVNFKLYINSVEPIALAFEEKGVGKVHPSYKCIGDITVKLENNVITDYVTSIKEGIKV